MPSYTTFYGADPPGTKRLSLDALLTLTVGATILGVDADPSTNRVRVRTDRGVMIFWHSEDAVVDWVDAT